MNDYSGWAAGFGIGMFLIAITIYLGILALMLWVGYLIIRTAVKNGILKADEERARRAGPFGQPPAGGPPPGPRAPGAAPPGAPPAGGAPPPYPPARP